ncbi:MAG: hypothetical protein R6U98_23130 [Pirellulaceae bacterium]
MWKRHLTRLSVIVLAITLGVFSTGCQEEAPPPPPQQPQQPQQPQGRSPERERPQQPQDPARPGEKDNTGTPSGEQDSPAW